jgi:hypothetical protein
VIITKENDNQIETYELVHDVSWYWQITIKPYAKTGRQSGISRKFKSQVAAMKAISRKIVELDETTLPR